MGFAVDWGYRVRWSAVQRLHRKRLLVEFDYTDAKGVTTHRIVSPIRFLGRDRFLGLCLSREEPRQFYLERCQNVRLAAAADFLMPVAMAG
jgi:predicted DNA-binding transcriptional regulator YafY